MKHPTSRAERLKQKYIKHEKRNKEAYEGTRPQKLREFLKEKETTDELRCAFIAAEGPDDRDEYFHSKPERSGGNIPT